MIKHRSMWRQVLLFIITLGIYGIYRYCATFKEMVEHQGQEENAVLWTILALIPIGSLFSFWKYGGLVEGITNNKYPHRLLFVLLIFMELAAWLISQLEPNKPATQEA